MKHVLTLLLVICFYAVVFPQDYYERNRFALTSPGAMKFGLYGFNNPAVLANVESPDLLFTWSDLEGEWNQFNNWGLFAAFPNFSFAVINEKAEGNAVTDYKLSAGFGGPSYSIGLGFGWSNGDVDFFNHSNVFSIGALLRPVKYVSIGLMGNIFTSTDNEAIAEAAIRPFGNEILSLFGDYVFRKDTEDEFNLWSAGVALEAYPGIRLTGRYFENKFFTAGIELSFGRAGIFTQAAFDNDGNHQNNIYGIRIGAYDRNPFTAIGSGNKYMDVNLLGEVKYRRYRMFDNSNTLLDLLLAIDAAKNDKSISGIAINLSGMNINTNTAWELRVKLQEFKDTGKHIVIYIDNAEMTDYYLASAADKIVMDPMGLILIPGYVFGRQYYSGTLDKLGIGFTELKMFKYKTASESFSRKSLSESDKEQLGEILDVFYSTAKNDICKDRNITPDAFDKIINEDAMLQARTALERGLVDTLARWDAVKDIIRQLEGENKNFTGPGSLEKFIAPRDDYWGQKPQIAVIYALGACAMDQGITARKLVKDVENAGKDNDVKAIVFRVDSPGGDGLASDIVAEALKKASESKPVIVSQGAVAASGGYWLSMYGDTILAAPTTITGSIGVIAGWFYNKSFKESLGVSTDYIKKGEHADITYGMRIPFIGAALPDRDLTEYERTRFEKGIVDYYNDFVGKVSMGRNMSKAEIEKIAQGRVWSGKSGLANGLIDVLGGLDKAVKIAEERARLKGEEYELTELPEMPLFNWGSLLPNPFNIFSSETVQFPAAIENLLFRINNNGVPMPVLPMDEYFMFEEFSAY